jgi:hypothetical protein
MLISIYAFQGCGPLAVLDVVLQSCIWQGGSCVTAIRGWHFWNVNSRHLDHTGRQCACLTVQASHMVGCEPLQPWHSSYGSCQACIDLLPTCRNSLPTDKQPGILCAALLTDAPHQAPAQDAHLPKCHPST